MWDWFWPAAPVPPLNGGSIRRLIYSGRGTITSIAITEAGETTVNDSGGITIPARIREMLDVEPEDKIRWVVDDEGDLDVEVIRERPGAFDDFEPVDWGETNAEQLGESAWESDG